MKFGEFGKNSPVLLLLLLETGRTANQDTTSGNRVYYLSLCHGDVHHGAGLGINRFILHPKPQHQAVMAS